ncbi:putative PTH11-typeG-protein-coupled receptor [Trichoderma compactum]
MAVADAPLPNPNDNVSSLVYIPSAIFVVICPIVVALRVWARLRRGKMGPDDWTAIAALIFALLTSGFLVASCHYGMGRHFVYIEAHNKYETLKYLYMSQVTYKAAINLSKCSILLLYLRLFSIVGWFRWACWGVLTCVVIYCISSMIATIFQCSPVVKAFNKTLPGTCIDLARFWFANAGFSIATDIIILMLPMPLVYQLEVPRAQKIALMAVFAVGIFVVVTSCLRVATLDVFATSPDNTYDIANVMWTIIEPNVAVICASLPILRPLVVKLFPALKSKNSANRYGSLGYAEQPKRTRRSQMIPHGDDWAESSRKPNGIYMATLRGRNSNAGSEENIMPLEQNGTSAGIQETVGYTIQYSEKS